MREKLITRGNTAVWLFNHGREDMLRFEWVKRFLLSSFSYDEFMNVSRGLMDLAGEHQSRELEAKVLAFDNQEDYLEALSLSGGQDDASLNRALAQRKSYQLEEFSPEAYETSIDPQLTVKTPNEKSHFMITLSAQLTYSVLPRILPAPLTHLLMPSISLSGQSGEPYFVQCTPNYKRRLEFYGQSLKPELFTEIVKKYHKPGLSHSLNHGNIHNPLSYVLCKV